MWINGRAPILCSIICGSIDINIASPSDHLTKAVTRGDELAGVMGRLIAHDLRRESAQDISRLSPHEVSVGIATEEVAAAIGHSRSSLRGGITSRYGGKPNNDLWRKRIREESEDAFDLQVAEQPLPKRQKLTTKEVDGLCDKYHLDKTDQVQRTETCKVHYDSSHTTLCSGARIKMARQLKQRAMEGNFHC